MNVKTEIERILNQYEQCKVIECGQDDNEKTFWVKFEMAGYNMDTRSESFRSDAKECYLESDILRDLSELYEEVVLS